MATKIPDELLDGDGLKNFSTAACPIRIHPDDLLLQDHKDLKIIASKPKRCFSIYDKNTGEFIADTACLLSQLVRAIMYWHCEFEVQLVYDGLDSDYNPAYYVEWMPGGTIRWWLGGNNRENHEVHESNDDYRNIVLKACRDNYNCFLVGSYDNWKKAEWHNRIKKLFV